MCGLDASVDNTILVCDRCDEEFHMLCLNPPVTVIPEGDWFCPACDASLPVPKLKHATSDKGNHISPSADTTRPSKKKRTARPQTSVRTHNVADDSEDMCMICG